MADHPPGDHYFSSDPQSPSAERQVRLHVHGREFVFWTDAGVFSPRSIDRGTRLLISALPLPLVGEVLDWGAGYGPIGIAVAALSPHAHVLMAEINERAANLARRNVRSNGVGDAAVLAGDAFQALGDCEFDFVITNPPIRAGKQVVSRLIRDARKRLRPGGELWMVIRTQAGAKSYRDLLQTLFPRVQRVAMQGGYRVFRASVNDGVGAEHITP